MNNTKQFNEPLIKIRDLKKYFPLKKTRLFQRHALTVKANDGVDLVINRGETLGLVGESGCGKSTLGRVIPQLYPKTSGDIIYYGYTLDEINPDYYFDDIKSLPRLQKKYHDYKNKITSLEKEIEDLKSKRQEDPKQLEKIDRISVLRKEIEKIHEDGLAKNGVTFVTKSIKQLEQFNELSMTILKNEEKLLDLNKQLNKLYSEYETAKLSKDPEAEKEYLRLKAEVDKASVNELGRLHKKIAITERKVHRSAHDVELKIKAQKADINVLVNDNENARLRLVSGLDKVRDYNDVNVKSLYEVRKAYLLKEKELNQLTYEVEYGAQKNQIQRYQKRIDLIIGDVARIVGGLLLVDDFKSLSNAFYKKFSLSRKIKNLRNTVEVYQNKIQLLKKKIDDATFTDAQRDYMRLSIQKTEEDIKVSELEIDQLVKESDVYDTQINELRKTVENHPEYQMYESQHEKGIDLSRLSSEETRQLRKDLQIIFQDPYSSLNPRLTVGQIIGEGLRAHGIGGDSEDNKERILEIMEKCGLAPYMLHRYPHQFSGGQRQRIGIARALAVNPTFVVCDEAVSALDVSIQSQIINLLEDLREQENLTYLFISHDLSVIKHISDRIGVMYLGKIVEMTDKNTLFNNPLHPYTKALISAIPTTESDNSERIILKGDIPSNVFPPSGCKFRTRCPIATNKCAQIVPEMKEVEPGHFVACHYHEKTKDIRPD